MAQTAHEHDPSGHKVASLTMYVAIYVALMVLLVLTVAVGRLELGIGNIIVAMIIAVIKALLVVLFFMHVKDGTRLTWIFVASSFLFFGLLVIGVCADFTAFSPAREPGDQAGLVFEHPPLKTPDGIYRNPLRPMVP